MRWPSGHFLLTFGLLLAAAGLRIADPDLVARFRLSVFDAYLQLAPRALDETFPVRIIDIDAQSLARLGQRPWPRTRLAHIIDRLREAGARAIVLDMILPEPDRLSPSEIAKLFAGTPDHGRLAERAAALPSNDEVLTRAIAAAPAVLGFVGAADILQPPPAPRARFAFAGDDPKLFVPAFAGGIGSLEMLNAGASGLAALNWLPVHDQVVRRIPLLLAVAGSLYPSLPLEALRVTTGQSTIFVRSSGGSGAEAFGQKTGISTIHVGSVSVPTDASGQLWLRFAPADQRRYIPAHRIIEGQFNPQDIAGRIVLIGASAPALLDLKTTPLEPAVPGVEIHAQAIEQMLSGKNLTRPDYATGAELSFLIVVGAVVAWLIRRSGPLTAALIGAFSIAAVSAVSWLVYVRSGFLFDPVYPSLALLLLYTASTLLNYTGAERSRARVHAAFAHYMAPALVDELASHPDKLKLGGETREVTLLFADVRGFSKISEGMDAEALVHFVNRIFTPLSAVILAERGTIDKFIGDAVMAFWNAPLDDADHARNACRAALHMIAELKRLNAVWAAEATTQGIQPAAVRIGIGLNTGKCCVGNLGSPQRFDYSIIGDAVNTASRLQVATKTYGVPIIAGAATASAAADFAFLEIDSVMLTGKERPERIFALLGDETVAASERFQQLKAQHDALRNALAMGDIATAIEALDHCTRLALPESAALLETYGRRLARSA